MPATVGEGASFKPAGHQGIATVNWHNHIQFQLDFLKACEPLSHEQAYDQALMKTPEVKPASQSSGLSNSDLSVKLDNKCYYFHK